MINRFVTVLFFLVCCKYALTQNCTILPVIEKISIDGNLSENIWKQNSFYSTFYQHYPYDTSIAKTQTLFLIAADAENIYAAFKCVNVNPKKDFVIQSLKRDFSVNLSDAVLLSINTFGDGQNGFSFGVTPQNAQREGALENGGNFGVTTAWDQIWYSATKIATDTWFAEFKIPLKSIRFKDNFKNWKINVARTDYKNNEVSTWIVVPRNFNISALGFAGNLIWSNPPKKRGINMAIIPYISNISSSTSPVYFTKNKTNIGTDIKFALSSALNADITINPDFAQVDVDEQQINLTQFSLFFPERRQFFIENSDLFANFGFRQIRPFFSRSIGLKSGAVIPIIGGARITGKINNKLRIGAMHVSTKNIADTVFSIEKNYEVVAAQYKVFSASNIGCIVVNQFDNVKKQNFTNSGIEYNLLSKKNDWVGKAFIQHALNPIYKNKNFAHASFLMYRDIHKSFAWNHEYVAKNFSAPVGFVPRSAFYDFKKRKAFYFTYWRLEPDFNKTFYPKNSTINSINIDFYNSTYFDSSFKTTERFSSIYTKFSFQDSREFRFSFNNTYQYLFLPFTLLNSTKYLQGKYQWNYINIGFSSNNRKKINGTIDYNFGTYYNGQKSTLNGTAQIRRQPWGLFSFNMRWDRLFLDSLFSSKKDVVLIGIKSEISFSTTKYFTTFIQYNTQQNNININLRLQWRYRPMSDLFIVYTENYFPDVRVADNVFFPTKNRSLAVKLNFWFNT